MASHSMEEVPLIKHSELTDVKPLGQGGFGVVYRAKHERLGTVVYKELNATILQDRIQHELRKEARMSILEHINIVALFAIILELGHYGLVMEYVLHGALDGFIVDYLVDWPLKLSLAHGIVCGMNYLHSLQPPVIHSDLKIQNVLVTDNLQAKICDFGLAKWKLEAATQTTTEKRRGTVAYMAPEVFKNASTPRTMKYDVYGFGILLWALLSEKIPFEHAFNEQIKSAVGDGDRPPLNEITGPDDLVSFATRWIVQCWHQSPDERPSFSDLEKQFIEVKQRPSAKSVCRPFLRQPKSKLAVTLQIQGEVRGVTHLDNIMYVVCGSSSTVRLYNMDTYSLLDTVIDVQGMRRPLDIVVCYHDRQLYIADCRCIWRVSVDDHKSVKWLTIDSTDRFYILSLSLTSRRLLVTSDEPPSLRQYSITDGRLERVVEMPRYVQQLYHAVESTRETFIIGHRGTPQDEYQQYAVSEVDMAGHVMSTFTDVSWPYHLSVVSDGGVLVADYSNDRILLLTSELCLQHVLIDRHSQVKLPFPERLHYNEHKSQLYVVHSSSSEWTSPDIISVISLL